MRPSTVYIETTHTAVSNSRTGIQAVVRGLVAGLSSQGTEVCPVRWSFKRQCLTPLKSKWERNLGLPGEKSPWLPLNSLLNPRFWTVWRKARGMIYKTPLHRHPTHEEQFKKGWLILPELMEGLHVRLITDYAKTQGVRTAGIFHDAISWHHPDLVKHWTRKQHAEYMMAFAELDVVIAVSHQAARHFVEFAQQFGGTLPEVKVCGLAAEIIGQKRETRPKTGPDEVMKILCVSTLEPRKNHIRIIEAFERASGQLAGRKVELHLVGAFYQAAPEIADMVRTATARNPAIFWHQDVGAEELRAFYRDCDFTVFGSWIEGFGLPVVESLWFGKACLCSNQGVMAENAVDGGCLTVDTLDVVAMAEGMLQLASEPELRNRLEEQALKRELKSWKTYAGEILDILSMTPTVNRSR